MGHQLNQPASGSHHTMWYEKALIPLGVNRRSAYFLGRVDDRRLSIVLAIFPERLGMTLPRGDCMELYFGECLIYRHSEGQGSCP